MFEQHFANYLLEKQRISQPQYALVKEEMKTGRVKLGVIAIAEKLLTAEQAEELNFLQRQTDRRFGDLAVEKGYLFEVQVDRLLKLQGNPYLRLVQILTENEIMTMDQIDASLADYLQDTGFSQDDLQVLKAGDLDSIIPLFVRTDNALALDYISLAIRNVIRFIDNQPLVKQMEEFSTYSVGNLAYQQIVGEHKLWLGFGSKENELIKVASPFAREDFLEMDEDAFDSVCEFINCINGLFSGEMSHKDVILDMEPPQFGRNQKLSCADRFFVVPIVLGGQQVDLIAAVDVELEIK